MYKGLTKLITNILTKKFDEYQFQVQAGFLKNYSTNDHLLTMKILTECSIYREFVDNQKVFDSIETWAQKLQNYRNNSFLKNIARISRTRY